MKFKLFFAWYDLWVGVYIDRDKDIVYFCPLPMVVFSFSSDKNRWNGEKWISEV